MKKILKLLILPFAFAFVLFIRWMAPKKIIRIGLWWYRTRLGHLIGNTECYLAEKDRFHPDTFDIWIRAGEPANKDIDRKYRKILHTMPHWFGSLVLACNRLFRDCEKHQCESEQQDRDIHNLCARPHLNFTEREEKKGKKLLRQLGLPEGAKWVCLFVRDSAYLRHQAPGADFSYHDYRDSDISDCIPAALELVRRGYYVIRMGNVVGKPFNIKHPHVIDYPLSGKCTDFGSLYLGAKCAFALGSHSGFMSIPQAFKRPIAIINYVPVEYMPTFANGLLIWKHHKKEDKELTLAEIGEARLYLSSQQFAQAGITLVDNSTQEIYQLAVQMADFVEGKTGEDEQTEFWERFPRSYVNGKPLHGKMVLRIGREFLNARLQNNGPAGHQGKESRQAVAV